MPKSAFALFALLFGLIAFLSVPAFSADDKLDSQMAELAKKLKSKSAAEQIKTLQEIGKRGEEAKPLAKSICETGQNATPQVYAAVLDALSKVSPELAKPVGELGDKDINKKLRAIQELAKMGREASPAIVLLIADMKKVAVDPSLPNGFKRIIFDHSMDALVNMGPDDANVITALMTLGSPKNTELDLRSTALRNLANMTDGNPKLTKQFIPMVTTAVNDPKMRLVGVELAGKLPLESAKPLLPTLTKLKNDKDATISRAASDSLIRMEAMGEIKTVPPDPKNKDAVVTNAIAWIVRNQMPNGSWRTAMGDNRPAIVTTTSFCAMSLLATGNPKLRPLAGRATSYVIENMFEDKSDIKTAPEWDQTNWSVAIGGLFLCEYYAAMKGADSGFKSPEIEKNIEKSIAEAFRRMEPATGGWGHTPRLKNPLGYVELEIVSNWMLAMLGSAQKLGFKLDEPRLNLALKFIEDCCNAGKGGVGYSPRPGQKGFECPNRTGGAVFVYGLLGKKENPLYGRMIESWKGTQTDIAEGHGSAAMGYIGSALGARQMGDDEWKTFSTTMFPAIQGCTTPDGNFTFLKGTTVKSTGFDHKIGTAYNTGIYTLILLLDSGKLKFMGNRQA
jgi:hypothetical protein